MTVKEAMRRSGAILGLLSLFLVLGGPGGGGLSASSSSSSSSSSSNSSDSFDRRMHAGYHPNPPMTRGRLIITLAMLVGIPLTIGLIIRRSDASFARKEAALPQTTECVTLALLCGDPATHVAFCDDLLKRTNLHNAEERIGALREFARHLQSVSAQEGFVHAYALMDSRLTAAQFADSLSEQQIVRTDAGRPAGAVEACLMGLTITVLPQALPVLSPNTETALPGTVLWQQLQQLPAEAVDAVYLFYAPGLEDSLSAEQGQQMLADLRRIANREDF